MNSNDGQAYVAPSRHSDLSELYKAGKITLAEYQAEVHAREKAIAEENRKHREQEEIKKDLVSLKERVNFYQRTTFFCFIACIVVLILSINNRSDIKELNKNAQSVNSGVNEVNSSPKYENADNTVYVTDTGSTYHNSNCSYLRSKNKLTLKKAVDSGYSRCNKCNPPALKEAK